MILYGRCPEYHALYTVSGSYVIVRDSIACDREIWSQAVLAMNLGPLPAVLKQGLKLVPGPL